MGVSGGLAVWTSETGRTAVVQLTGEHDLVSAPDLRQVLRESVSAETRLVVLDLADCTFVDSSVLGVLAGTYRWLTGSEVELIAVNATGLPARVLAMMAMDELLAPRPRTAGGGSSGEGEQSVSGPASST